MGVPDSAVVRLERAVKRTWPNVRAARSAADDMRASLAAVLEDETGPDTVLVAYGSLARGEFTQGSDLDWTLLVNGPASPEQLESIPRIRAKLAAVHGTGPNPTGPFGSISSGYELVHRIGGESDTNRITTQRVLLLLESIPIRDTQHDLLAHDRVVRAVLNSYLAQSSGTRERSGVPRFLLNDMVRYWRTMGVDYAAKRRERDDSKWALRRLKLRTSRKLIFAAGLVMCLDYHVRVVKRDGQAPDRAKLLDNLVMHVGHSPLEALALVALSDPEMTNLGGALFDAYDRFLGLLGDKDRRNALESLGREGADDVPVHQEAEAIGDSFGAAVEAFFFDSSYASAIRSYGVF